MSRYIDGFVIPVKKKDLKEYKKLAVASCKIWMKHGALDFYECVADKLDNPYGIPFDRLYKLKKDETLIFSYIVYKSKAHCNSVNKKVFKDASMNFGKEKELPFNMKRFSAGKFKTLIHT